MIDSKEHITQRGHFDEVADRVVQLSVTRFGIQTSADAETFKLLLLLCLVFIKPVNEYIGCLLGGREEGEEKAGYRHRLADVMKL